MLQPSLTDDAPIAVPFSARAGFLVAFFGGALPAILFSLQNARRLRRPARELALHGIATLVLFVAITAVMSARMNGAVVPGAELLGGPTRALRYMNQALGLALFGASYALHRRYYKAAESTGQPHPNPWPWGLGTIGIGVALYIVAGLLAGVLPR